MYNKRIYSPPPQRFMCIFSSLRANEDRRGGRYVSKQASKQVHGAVARDRDSLGRSIFGRIDPERGGKRGGGEGEGYTAIAQPRLRLIGINLGDLTMRDRTCALLRPRRLLRTARPSGVRIKKN